MLDGIENVFKKDNEREFVQFARAFSEREEILDGKCAHLVNQGNFHKGMMERCGFLRMTGKHGITRIVIEYDADTGLGWWRIVREPD